MALPVALAIASLAMQGASLYNKNKAAEEAQDYANLVEMERKRAARRQAIARVIGNGFITKGYEDPKAPDLTPYQTRAGLFDYGSNIFSQGAGLYSGNKNKDKDK